MGKQMDGDDDFFLIENMASAFTVLDYGKRHIDPENLWEGEEMLVSIRHLFITREDNDRPITEGQDGEQESNGDEDNASDAGSNTPQAPKPHTPSDPAS